MSALYHKDDAVAIHLGDCRDILPTLEPGSAQTCVTSPPYFGLRDYGHESQIGLERTPDEYVAALVAAFRDVRRVLADDGTLWLNLGDSYANDGKWGGHSSGKHACGGLEHQPIGRNKRYTGLKPKDLVGIPWRVAFALQADGWWLRSDIIWHKPNPMPESVTDRPTKAHEYLFLLTKAERYYYDAKAIAEPATFPDGPNAPDKIKPPYGQGYTRRSGNTKRKMGDERGRPGSHLGGSIPWEGATRNKRSVWTVSTRPYKGAHFATFPPDLIRPCILAGAPVGGVVLDPFGGSGTTGMVAKEHGRRAVLIEAKPDYCALSRDRCGTTPQRTDGP